MSAASGLADEGFPEAKEMAGKMVEGACRRVDVLSG